MLLFLEKFLIQNGAFKMVQSFNFEVFVTKERLKSKCKYCMLNANILIVDQVTDRPSDPW